MERFFLVLAAILFLMLFSGCQNEPLPLAPITRAENQTAAQKAPAALAEVSAYKIVAQHLAQLSRHAWFRAQLRDALASANFDRQGILTLQELRAPATNFTAQHNLFTQAFEQLAGHADVYFPVGEHFERFMNGASFITTFAAGTADSLPHEMTGYYQDGRAAALSPDIPPKIPALVVVACEHRGIHQSPNTRRNAQMPAAGDLILDEIEIYNGHEPWWKGAPDIQINVHKNTNVCRATWSNYDRLTNLPQVDVTYQTYFPNLALWGWSAGSSFGKVLVRVYEDDSSDGSDHMGWFLVERATASREFKATGECRIKVHSN